MDRIRIVFMTALAVYTSRAFSATVDVKSVAGAPAPETAAEAKESSDAEAVDVDAIKKKYWASGDESQLGVVQNRLYSKAHKFQLGFSGGISFSDPFLSMKPIGGSMGYFFNETWGLNLVGWKTNTSGSGALAVLQASGKDVNVTLPSYYVGVEGVASILYGKLSLIGSKIIYYDMYLTGGIGLTGQHYDIVNPVTPAPDTSEFTTTVGVGQRFYAGQHVSLRLDYRLMYYTETQREKVITTKTGSPAGTRADFTHSIQVGVDYLFGI